MTDLNNETFPLAISDRYEVIRLLGEGGMSRVYLAKDQQLPRSVAIKCILPELTEKPEVVTRIEREVQTHASIGINPNIVALFDKIEADGKTYLIMEYVEGDTLDVWLTEHQPSQAQVHGIVADILNALKTIHARNVVHRDIKPENIILSIDDGGAICAKLMDFGISQDENLTSTATKLTQIDIGTPGSPAYMSPEQIDPNTFGDVGAASDLYAVGIILYEMVTQSPPFAGTMTQILTAHLVTTPDIENQSLQHSGLQGVIEKALAKDQHQRFASAADFLAALKGGEVASSSVQKTQLAVKLKKPTVNKTQLHVTQTTSKRSKGRWMGLSFLAVVSVAGAGYFYQTNVRTSIEPDAAVVKETAAAVKTTESTAKVDKISAAGSTVGSKPKLGDATPKIQASPVKPIVPPIEPFALPSSTQALDAFRSSREQKQQQESTTQSVKPQAKQSKSSSSKPKQTASTKKKRSGDRAIKSSKTTSRGNNRWSVTRRSSSRVN